MSFWNEIPKPIIGLSPMDGVTDASYRFIAAKHGRPDVILTEFVSVDAAAFAPHSLLRDFAYSEIERPVLAQVYGHTPEAFYRVAHIVCELGFDGLDINMGCPAKKVAAKGSGAGLILTPELAREIIRATGAGIRDWAAGQSLDAVGVDPEFSAAIKKLNRMRCGLEDPAARRIIPVSVKTRIGYDAVVVVDWIRNLLEEKPAAISIHGRTLQQQYSGSADWTAIARAVEVAGGSGTLILGNGDLRGMADVYRRVRETRVDGVLLGRAAQGNPWIFQTKDEVKRGLRENRSPVFEDVPVPIEERFRVALEHCRHFAAQREAHAFVSMRKHLSWYCKFSRGIAALRGELVHVNGVDDVVECFRKYAATLGGMPIDARSQTLDAVL
ncbi:MAG TPA: tRNA-dihydrouridine synthase [Candidatus Binatia bacterium]|jgi:tRNA-dihydrouridine synthase|nr:tRNA-dihydrouridine synthase [Candidatus Binatia bacterium]